MLALILLAGTIVLAASAFALVQLGFVLLVDRLERAPSPRPPEEAREPVRA